MRWRPRPLATRPPCFSNSTRSAREERSAGNRPKSRPVARDSPRMNATARPSSATSSRRGRLRGLSTRSTETLARARRRAARPPEPASTRLSASHCRTSRLRLAPRAARIATSLPRESPWASRRLVTFAQAIRRTNATDPARTSRAGRTRLTTGSCSASTFTAMPAFDSGRSVSRRRATTPSSARAFSRVAPGRRRPNTRRKRPWLASASAVKTRGAHSSAAVAQNGGNRKPGGITPATT